MSRKPAKGEYIETVSSSLPLSPTSSPQIPNPKFPILCPQTSRTKERPLLTHTPLQDTGNKVSRRSQIIGTTNIILGGKTVIQAEVIIRGDLLRTYPPSNPNEKQGNPVAVAIGRYCFFSRACELRPPGKLYKGFVGSVILYLSIPVEQATSWSSLLLAVQKQHTHIHI